MTQWIKRTAQMDIAQSLVILLVGATACWVYLKLKARIEFLEHEVRWLRKELEDLKPTDVKTAFD
jgi:hypothetical protein